MLEVAEELRKVDPVKEQADDDLQDEQVKQAKEQFDAAKKALDEAKSAAKKKADDAAKAAAEGAAQRSEVPQLPEASPATQGSAAASAEGLVA
eukprot:12179908-Alexandrium_andersonii.AAC.1